MMFLWIVENAVNHEPFSKLMSYFLNPLSTQISRQTGSPKLSRTIFTEMDNRF